jgi:hypothetical protein
MMSVLDLKTAEPSSSLTKGIAKEREIAKILRHKYPKASVTCTSPTGDGGKDIIVKRGGKVIYYEVKNWKRPMSAYDVRQYIDVSQSVSADMKIINEGGFTEGAISEVEDTGISLVNGQNLNNATVLERIDWAKQITKQRLQVCIDHIKRRLTKSGESLGKFCNQITRWLGSKIRGIASKTVSLLRRYLPWQKNNPNNKKLLIFAAISVLILSVYKSRNKRDRK